MKKAQIHLETPIKIFLIVLILLVLILGVLPLLQKGSSSPIKIFDSWLEKFGFSNNEQDLNTLNDLAQKNFDNLISEMNSCIKTKKNNCKCLTNGFSDFKDIHAIEIQHDKMRLLLVNNGNELTKSESKISPPECYTTRDGFALLLNPSKITFNDGIKLDDSNGKSLEFKKEVYVLYKNPSNELCWLTNERDSGPLEVCN